MNVYTIKGLREGFTKEASGTLRILAGVLKSQGISDRTPEEVLGGPLAPKGTLYRVEQMMDIEEEYGIQISDFEEENINNLEDLRSLIKIKITQG